MKVKNLLTVTNDNIYFIYIDKEGRALNFKGDPTNKKIIGIESNGRNNILCYITEEEYPFTLADIE